MFLNNQKKINFTSCFRIQTFRLYYILLFWTLKIKNPPPQFCFIFRVRKQWNKIGKWNKIELRQYQSNNQYSKYKRIESPKDITNNLQSIGLQI